MSVKTSKVSLKVCWLCTKIRFKKQVVLLLRMYYIIHSLMALASTHLYSSHTSNSIQINLILFI